ncbi:hypothetical protein SAICODRAFT_23261 [Saitoella complicata NRRL Y-17804]|uniref:Uncharacterized protein n=1 Tax=Saitoella complicata (strain BCRC 22490 / CBS 7301 / JCM 7358 / NBRC 10748 / NRRL Y-17804) TaxID=698492 RepID=A0A0E9NT83_SAICN|nr:uncharacterized protein SAICODRAFT_23261 [Saitoella complicata NRRL Y-17804]ODQ55924.1 hypothetical protein SAICODRAFT_23261 [Saitoella complicata NRRL Y-17804]GAO52625.1 hypothetical protein G7K_6698-t1 [Saitoella complicata NRRL Y-17804]
MAESIILIQRHISGSIPAHNTTPKDSQASSPATSAGLQQYSSANNNARPVSNTPAQSRPSSRSTPRTPGTTQPGSTNNIPTLLWDRLEAFRGDPTFRRGEHQRGASAPTAGTAASASAQGFGPGSRSRTGAGRGAAPPAGVAAAPEPSLGQSAAATAELHSGSTTPTPVNPPLNRRPRGNAVKANHKAIPALRKVLPFNGRIQNVGLPEATFEKLILRDETFLRMLDRTTMDDKRSQILQEFLRVRYSQSRTAELSVQRDRDMIAYHENLLAARVDGLPIIFDGLGLESMDWQTEPLDTEEGERVRGEKGVESDGRRRHAAPDDPTDRPDQPVNDEQMVLYEGGRTETDLEGGAGTGTPGLTSPPTNIGEPRS